MAAAAPAALDCWGALEEQALTEVVSTALGRPVRLAGFEDPPAVPRPVPLARGAGRLGSPTGSRPACACPACTA